jgi:hypothetical protein
MSQCIYTGARVLFAEYGALVAADLFQCGDQVLIQWMPQSLTYDWESEEVTHNVTIDHGYHHAERGITVVPDYQCVGERR